MSALVEPGPPLTPEQRERYSRQIMLPGMGETGQRRLLAARVLVIGAGGLGAPALMSLAAAGVGVLGVVDSDRVELSNLQRQLLHRDDDIGWRKTDSAHDALLAMNPGIEVRTHPVRLTADNAHGILSGYDLVVDGSDNFATRYLVDDTAAALGMPLVWGSVLRFEGQLGLVWAARGVRYRDLYPDVPAAALDCATAGVFGPLCALVGTQLAAEAIKLVTGVGSGLLGRVAVVDALTAGWRTLAFAAAAPDEEPPAARAGGAAHDTSSVPLVTAAELRHELAGPRPPLVVDVRGPDEQGGVPGAIRWPLDAIEAGEPAPARLTAAAATGVPIVLHCAVGVRSRRAAEALAARAEGIVARSLAGGLTAWLALDGAAAPECAVEPSEARA